MTDRKNKTDIGRWLACRRSAGSSEASIVVSRWQFNETYFQWNLSRQEEIILAAVEKDGAKRQGAGKTLIGSDHSQFRSQREVRTDVADQNIPANHSAPEASVRLI